MIRRSTAIILALFVLLLAGTLIWQRQQKQVSEKTTPTPSQQSLLNLDGKITSLQISDSQGKMVDLQLNDKGEWQLKSPEAKQTDVNAADNAISQLLSLQVLSTLEQTSSEATGLVTPTYTILLKLDNGKQSIINVGKPTPTGSGYYVLTSDKKLSVVEKSGLDMVLGLVDNPPIVATPTPEATVTPQVTPASSPTVPAASATP